MKRCHLPLKTKQNKSSEISYLQLSFGKLRWKITVVHLRLIVQLSSARRLIAKTSWISSQPRTFTIAEQLIVLTIALSIMSEHRLHPLYWLYRN